MLASSRLASSATNCCVSLQSSQATSERSACLAFPSLMSSIRLSAKAMAMSCRPACSTKAVCCHLTPNAISVKWKPRFQGTAGNVWRSPHFVRCGTSAVSSEQAPSGNAASNSSRRSLTSPFSSTFITSQAFTSALVSASTRASLSRCIAESSMFAANTCFAVSSRTTEANQWILRTQRAV